MTIKGYDKEFGIYRLGFPNKEVENGFIKYLLPFYTPVTEQESSFIITSFVMDIRQGNVDSFMQRLQSMKAGSDRTKLEKDVMAQRQTFSQKAQAFEQDRARRSNEERGKLVTRIQTAVKSVANSQSIDLVVDANTVAYNSSDVKDITADVLKQVK